MPVASIVIPVYNQWDLTRACLRSIRATTSDEAVEVILVDNGSTDVTARAAPFLGKQLFGRYFTFIRNTENRNFAGASNQGARAAATSLLLFLNNDTVLLPNWLERLTADFSIYPNLAGTGPLLVYPEKPLLGHTVQHLGVSVSPFHKLRHLYEGIPAASPLARKRRFFQIITAACLLMPKELFLGAGGFDEGYINGFEDVDLCARLSAAGYRFTVNPEARVIHYQGQSAGRSAAEGANSLRLQKKVLPLLRPDKAELLAADGMRLGLNDWMIQTPFLAPEIRASLDSQIEARDANSLLETLVEYPCWNAGWQKLLADLPDPEKERLADTVFKLAPEPAVPMRAAWAALAMGDPKKAAYWLNTASVFCLSEAAYLEECAKYADLAFALGETALAREFEAWSRKATQFFQKDLRPFIADFARLARELKLIPPRGSKWAFALDFNPDNEVRDPA